MRKSLPASEKKVRVWSDILPSQKLALSKMAKAHKEADGNLSAFIRIKLEEAIALEEGY